MTVKPMTIEEVIAAYRELLRDVVNRRDQQILEELPRAGGGPARAYEIISRIRQAWEEPIQHATNRIVYLQGLLPRRVDFL